MTDQPVLELDLRPSVPAAVLRVTAGLAAGLAVLLVGYQQWVGGRAGGSIWDGVGSLQLNGWSVVLGIAASAWLVWRTQDHVAPFLAVGIGVASLGADGGITWRTFLLAGLVLVMLRSAALVGGLAWDARIEIDVLRPVARSTGWLLVAVAVTGAVVGLLDQATEPDRGMKVLGAAAVLVVAVWLLPRRWLRR